MRVQHVAAALLALFAFSTPASAGVTYYGRGKTKGEARSRADHQAYNHAKRMKSCYHPARRYPVAFRNGVYIARAVSASHRGSCPYVYRPRRQADYEY
jgi:hypothetical protein